MIGSRILKYLQMDLSNPHIQSGFPTAFADEIEQLERWSLEHQVSLQPPNSMHDYGIEMRLIGIDRVLQQFTTDIADRIVLELFPEVRDGGVDHHHAFSVTYGDDPTIVRWVFTRMILK